MEQKRSCKECEKTYRETHKNPDYHKKYNKVYKQNNIEKVLWLAAKKRSSSKGLVFTITVEDINIPEYCPILGIKIEVNGEKINSPSLDRIDSKKGYVKDNIQIISWRANWLKGNASLEEIKKLGEWLQDFLDLSLEQRHFLRDNRRGLLGSLAAEG